MVVVISEYKLLNLCTSDVIGTTKLTVNVLKSIAFEDMRRSWWHVSVVKLEIKDPVLLIHIKCDVIPREVRSCVLPIQSLVFTDEFFMWQQAVVAELVVCYQGYATINVDQSAAWALELIARYKVVIHFKRRSCNIAIEIEDTGAISHLLQYDNLYIQVVSNHIVIKSCRYFLPRQVGELTRQVYVDIIGILNVHQRGLGILEIVLGYESIQVEGESFHLRVRPIPMSYQFIPGKSSILSSNDKYRASLLLLCWIEHDYVRMVVIEIVLVYLDTLPRFVIGEVIYILRYITHEPASRLLIAILNINGTLDHRHVNFVT